MPAYDTTVDPPAPFARVTLRHPNTGAIWSDAPMLLDSGADVTLVPLIAVEKLKTTAAPGKQYELMGFDGNISLASVVRLELVFLSSHFSRSIFAD